LLPTTYRLPPVSYHLRNSLSANILDPELNTAMHQAVALLHQQKKKIMTAEILLMAFIETTNCQASQLLRRFCRELGFRWSRFERDVERVAFDRRSTKDIKFDFITADKQRVALSEEVVIVFDEGLSLAESQNLTACHTGHALVIMAHESIGTIWPLQKHGITQPLILEALGLLEKQSTSRQTPLTNVMYQPKMASSQSISSVGLTPSTRPKSYPIYQRQDLLNDLVNRLSIMQGRHVILVGPVGVGKRSLVLALAQIVKTGQGPTGLQKVIELDEINLLSDAQTEIEAGLRLAHEGILFVPGIDRFFGGIRADFPETVCNELQKGFLRDDVVIIGATTEAKHEKLLRPTSLISEHSQKLVVPPTTVAETTAILQTVYPQFESDYGLTIDKQSLVETARLANRYYTDQPLPGSAIYVLHRACAFIKTNHKSDKTLNPDDVMATISLLTGVPITHMGADERDRYLTMVEQLHQRIIGQNEAVIALSRAVKMARVGLKDPHRPIGSFLFLGPTGVGKTELAKALAEFMFGTEDALIVLDMSEYMDDSAINRFIGAPPGYVGHEAGGQLTDAVKKRPYSVVLFDEVEKASVKVFDALLQVLEEGRLTSGQGETVNFSQAVILMTSNIGGRYLAEIEEQELAHSAAEAALREHFRPEFLNRLDEVIYFHPLETHHLAAILELLLAKESQLLTNRGLELSLTDAAKRWLLQQNEHPEWGARPLRRIIQKHIRERLADYILREDPPSGTQLKVRVKSGELIFETLEK